MDYLVILILAWPIAVLNAYVCHRRLVFRSTSSVRTELPRFSVVYVLTLAASLVLLPLLLERMPFNIYIIQAAFTIAVVAEVPLERLWHAVPSFPTRSELWLRLLESAGL